MEEIRTEEPVEQKNSKIKESKIPAERVVEVNHVSMLFNLANERVDSLKEYFIRLIKRKLHYKEFWVLNDINFAVKKGESIGLVGNNGAGKSTLLKLIAGVLEPTKGAIKTKGILAPLINLGAGFDMEATARDNIFLNGAVLGFSRKEMQEKYDSIVRFSELENYMNVPLKNFSSGMLARLGFAIAVDVDPDILLVDEVLEVGDNNFRLKCAKRINELKQKGTTIILVSHDLNKIKTMCTHALWLKNGRIFKYGTSKTVCDAYLEMCEQERIEKEKQEKETLEKIAKEKALAEQLTQDKIEELLN